MGACCSFMSGRSEPDRRHIYHLPSIEEHDLLSSSANENSPAGDFDASTPDTFRAPPIPLPYEGSGGLTVQQVLNNNNDDNNNGTGEDMEKEKGKMKELESLQVNEEEDDCPICLEEYEKENPRYFTRCEHEFHLACLLDWMERSETCPVCDQILMMDEMYQ